MTGKIKALIRDISIYGVNGVLGKSVDFLAIPFYTRNLNSIQYGALDTVNSIKYMLIIFLNLGIDVAVQRFYFDSDSKEHKIRLISTSFWFLIAWVFIFGFFAVLFMPYMINWIFEDESFMNLASLALISSFIQVIVSFSLNVLRTNFKTVQFTILSTLDNIGGSIAAILLVYFYGIEGFFYGKIFFGCISLIASIWLIREEIKFEFDFKIIQKILLFSLPFIPTAIAYWIFNLSDRIMLSKLGTMSEVGLYSLGNKLVAILAVLVMAFNRAWVPRAYEQYKISSENHVEFISNGLLYAAIGFSAISIYLSIFSSDIIDLLTTDEFRKSYIVIGPLVIGQTFSVLSTISANGIYIMKKTKYILIFAWISALINVVLNFITIPILGFVGAAISTAISYAVVFVAYLKLTEKLLLVKIRKMDVTKVLILMFAFIGINSILNVYDYSLHLFSKLVFCTSYFFILHQLRIISVDSIYSKVKTFIVSN